MKSVWFSLDVAPFVISLGMLHAIVLWNVWSNSTVLKTWQQFSFVGTTDAFFYTKNMRFLFTLEKKKSYIDIYFCIRKERVLMKADIKSAHIWRFHERDAIPREPFVTSKDWIVLLLPVWWILTPKFWHNFTAVESLPPGQHPRHLGESWPAPRPPTPPVSRAQPHTPRGTAEG